MLLDKVTNWGNEIAKDGCINVDAPDAKFIKELIMASNLNVAGKWPVKNYINKEIAKL